jgi:hypothetical protein
MKHRTGSHDTAAKGLMMVLLGMLLFVLIIGTTLSYFDVQPVNASGILYAETEGNDVFLPLESTWQFDTPMISAGYYFSAIGVNGSIYAIKGGSTTTTVEMATPGAGGAIPAWTLTQAASMPVHSACYWNGRVYAFTVATSEQLSQIYSSVVTETGGLGTWERVGELSMQRTDFAAVAANGRLYVVGGRLLSSERPRSTLVAPILPDGSVGTWQVTSLLNEQRSSNAAATHNGYIYAIGGDGGPPLNTVEFARINPDGSLGAWQLASNMIKARQWLPALVTNGYLYAIGGLSSSFEYTVEKAAINPDGSIGAWQNGPSMNTRRARHSGAVVGGYIYAIGGNDMYTDLSSVERVEVGIDQTGPQISSFQVNGQASSTPTTMVLLSTQASDATNAVGDLVMSLSNDGVNWSNWETYTAYKTWTLSAGNGSKSVCVRVRDPSGNVSGTVCDQIDLDDTVPAQYGLTINDGALFVNQTGVMLGIGAVVGTSEIQVSNDGGFAGALWETYTSHKNWQITQYGSYVIPRVVYVRYKDSNGNVSSTYQDDIILDLTPPTGSISIAGATSQSSERLLSSSGVTLNLSATDDVSGVGAMMLSNRADFSGATWEPYTTTRSWTSSTGNTVYARYKDNAGNISVTYSASIPGPLIQLTPTSLDFGYIKRGSFKDLTLEVKNIGTGTLTGSATTVAPFSINSAESYSLGPNQIQVITIRYLPTSWDTHTGTVIFSGGYGATIQVTGKIEKPLGLPWLMLLLN